jgi:hypothetical protein
MKTTQRDLLTVALLALAFYMKSPAVAIATVVLFGLSYAESILARSTKDAEIVSLVARADKYEKKLVELTADINNVAERASTVLGETYR